MRNVTTAAGAETSLDDYHWLTSPEAEPWLEMARALAGALLTVQVSQLRSHLSPPRTHLVLEQVSLRDKARAKFGAAGRMFFAPRLLEQASDEILATHKAQRFARGATALDLCCGLGGDLLALAERGLAVGVDRDPLAVLLAAANVRAARGEVTTSERAARDAEVQLGDVEQSDLAACAAWHIDPDRRPRGRRTTLVDLHEPGPEVIERMLARNANGAIKLSPAAQMPERWEREAELEWISRQGECRQLVCWFGDLARAPGQRAATVLDASGAPRTVTGMSGDDPPLAERVSRYVFEPDAAVLAAKLEAPLAAEYGLAAIAPGIAYWTGDDAVADAALACFAVREVMPFHLKAIKQWLRERGVGRLEIKKRGVDLDPAELRRKLALSGSQSATLLLLSNERRVTAIFAERIERAT